MGWSPGMTKSSWKVPRFYMTTKSIGANSVTLILKRKVHFGTILIYVWQYQRKLNTQRGRTLGLGSDSKRRLHNVQSSGEHAETISPTRSSPSKLSRIQSAGWKSVLRPTEGMKKWSFHSRSSDSTEDDNSNERKMEDSKHAAKYMRILGHVRFSIAKPDSICIDPKPNEMGNGHAPAFDNHSSARTGGTMVINTKMAHSTVTLKLELNHHPP